VEWNNTVLNLIKKARGVYQPHVLQLFTRSNLEFSLRKDWCNHLYLNGIIDHKLEETQGGRIRHFCRFSSPFVQECLYDAFTDDLFGEGAPMLAIEPGDLLSNVFTDTGLNLPPLLTRYKDYLARLKAEDIEPWPHAPRRQDLNITESVGHFHLYAWLREAIGDYASVTPEFPTGNGVVDLIVHYGETCGVLEVKSFRNMLQLKHGQAQVARYARNLGLEDATLALFVRTLKPGELEGLSGERQVDGVRVVTVAIGGSWLVDAIKIVVTLTMVEL